MEKVSFAKMEQGTQADYLLLDRYEQVHTATLTDRLLTALIAIKRRTSGLSD